MARDYFATLRQTLPRLGLVLRHLEPTYTLPSAGAVTAAFIEQEGVEAVLWDVDGTLMSYHAGDVDAAFSDLHRLFHHGPARHAILSNCDEHRFEQLGQMFPEIPIIRGYRTHAGPVFRHRWHGRDTHPPEAVHAMLSRSGSTQIRKPSAELVHYGMTVLEVGDPRTVLMVGDQYFTDVASANLAGARSVKVPTWQRRSFPLAIRFTQALEAAVYGGTHWLRSRRGTKG